MWWFVLLIQARHILDFWNLTAHFPAIGIKPTYNISQIGTANNAMAISRPQVQVLQVMRLDREKG